MKFVKTPSAIWPQTPAAKLLYNLDSLNNFKFEFL